MKCLIILHNRVTGQWVGGIESVKFCTFCRLPRVCMTIVLKVDLNIKCYCKEILIRSVNAHF